MATDAAAFISYRNVDADATTGATYRVSTIQTSPGPESHRYGSVRADATAVKPKARPAISRHAQYATNPTHGADRQYEGSRHFGADHSDEVQDHRTTKHSGCDVLQDAGQSPGSSA